MDNPIELIRRELPHLADAIAHLRRDSLRLHARPVDENTLGIGVSKLGGIPDLPAGFEWPAYEGEPLSFIAQLDLRDLVGYDVAKALPPAGVLSFFYANDAQPWGYDPDHRGGWRVCYFPEDAVSLVRTSPPDGLSTSGRFVACTVEFSVEITLPRAGSYWIHQLGMEQADWSRYYDVMYEISQVQEQSSPIHRVLGHPDAIQGDMLLKCQLVSHGLFCGDGSGYNDPRSHELEAGAKE